MVKWSVGLVFYTRGQVYFMVFPSPSGAGAGWGFWFRGGFWFLVFCKCGGLVCFFHQGVNFFFWFFFPFRGGGGLGVFVGVFTQPFIPPILPLKKKKKIF